MKQHCPHPDLLQVDPFEAIIDEEMERGILSIFRQVPA